MIIYWFAEYLLVLNSSDTLFHIHGYTLLPTKLFREKLKILVTYSHVHNSAIQHITPVLSYYKVLLSSFLIFHRIISFSNTSQILDQRISLSHMTLYTPVIPAYAHVVAPNATWICHILYIERNL